MWTYRLDSSGRFEFMYNGVVKAVIESAEIALEIINHFKAQKEDK